MKRKRDRLELKLLRGFNKEDISGCKGKQGVAVILRHRHAKIGDREKLLKYIKKNDAFDLFQNRLSSTAYFDRLEEGEKVPGVDTWEDIKVSVRKRK